MTTRTLINALCVTATLLPATLATAQPRPVPVPRPAPSPTPQQVETQTPVAEPLTLSEPVVGGLNNRDHTAADGKYVDYYQVELSAGHAYHFSVTGQGFATSVEVLNADGSELVGTKTYTDDNLFIIYTAKTAVYTIAVSTENAGDSGRYILHAVEGDERMPPRENQAGDVSIPAGTEPFAGELNDQSEISGQGRFFTYSIVELEAGQTYCLYVQSPDNGVFADIVSIDNNPVEYLAIEQEGAFIRVTPTVSGPHAISTITKRPGNATSYTGYAWAASTGSSTTIVDQLSAESVRLDDGTYFDFHEVELTADTTYVIDVTSEDFDAVAYLFDASNNQLAVNDQAEGTGTNAQITFTPETSGTYFVGVGTPTAGATGGYMARIASGDRIGQDAGISITRGDDVEEEMTGIPDSPLVGHWELVSVASNGRTEQVPAGAASYAFDADGNMTSYANGQVSDNSSYTVEGNRFSMTEADGSVEVSTFQIHDDTMTVTFVEPQASAGTVLVLKRIEAAPAPGANTNPALHGRWEATIVTANGQDNKIPAGALVFEFLPNGRVQMSDNGNVSGQGTYTNDGDALLISLDGEDAIEHNTFRVQGDTLTINTIIPPNTPAVIRFIKIEDEQRRQRQVWRYGMGAETAEFPRPSTAASLDLLTHRVGITPMTTETTTTRRMFLGQAGLALAGGCLAGRLPLAFAGSGDAPDPIARLGLITDVHYADIDTRGNRHYRDSLSKMRSAVSGLNELGVDAAVVMGDLIDSAGELESEINHLRTIETEYAKLDAERHYILGNHCVHLLTKEEFMENTGMDSPHSSFDLAGVRFIILDSCFTSEGEPYQRGNFSWTDANLPGEQLGWFEQQLEEAPGMAVVLTHQRIDGLDGPHNVRNGAAAREVMEASGKVRLVLSGHSHQNLHEQINGIDYVVVRAMVEGAGEDNNSFGRLLVYEDQSIRIEGHVQQDDVDAISAGD